MKYNQCHSRFNGELLNGNPLNGFLNGFGKNGKSGGERPKKSLLIFSKLQQKSPIVRLGFILKKSGKRDSNSRPRPWQGRALPTELLPRKRAENETRTRDPDLGKVVLYQLSYFRMMCCRVAFNVPRAGLEPARSQ